MYHRPVATPAGTVSPHFRATTWKASSDASESCRCLESAGRRAATISALVPATIAPGRVA